MSTQLGISLPLEQVQRLMVMIGRAFLCQHAFTSGVFFVPSLCRCWSGDPTDRPSIDMVLECLDLMIEARREQATMYATDSWQPTGDAVV